MRPLGKSADYWNRFAQNKDIRSYVERTYRRKIERDILPTLKPSELRALSFIISRTLGWQKFAEAIPKTHFQRGLVDEDRNLRCDDDGEKLCSGSGISKEETIRSACAALEEKGLITIFPGRPGSMQPAHVFMPFSEPELLRLMADGGSEYLPVFSSTIFQGEFLMARDSLWRVLQIGTKKIEGVRYLGSGKEGETVELEMDELLRLNIGDERKS